MARLIVFHPLEMRCETQGDKLVVTFSQIIEQRPIEGSRDRLYQVIDRREQESKRHENKQD